jgi:PAS domain S-box-containing protein
MVDPVAALTVLLVYLASLFGLAWWTERRAAAGSAGLVNNPVTYSLGLTVYYTSWTFYGSVGRAANDGMVFVAIYLGTIMPLLFWWSVGRRLVRVGRAFRLTSLADLISARHAQSRTLAAYVTVLLLVGVMPYIALQLKSVISTFELVCAPAAGGLGALVRSHIGSVITTLMIAFTIVFGVRRLDPTERHPGMVMAVAAEGVLKLVAFVVVGCFVVFVLFDGPVDIFDRLESSPLADEFAMPQADLSNYSLWISFMLVSAFAVMFLPRQFHMTVVENSDEQHLRTAMWVLPLYGLLITVLCFPVAIGGLLRGLPASHADTFVLQMPLDEGVAWLSLLVFVGGFAAASGMIMICTMTMATMVTNHVLVPAFDAVPGLGPLRRYVLESRWVAVALTLLAASWFERTVGGSYMLGSMGVISFVAAAQLAPSILLGLYWRRGTKTGAFIGLTVGFSVWAYTMIVPALARSGWLTSDIVEHGLLGVSFLSPEHLFGLSEVSPIANTVFWSLAFNTAGYILGSLIAPASPHQQSIADEFVDILSPRTSPSRAGRGSRTITLGLKTAAIESVLRGYLPGAKARQLMDDLLHRIGLAGRRKISVLELADLTRQAERLLGGSIGAATAHSVFRRSRVLTTSEEEKLTEAYAELLARLRITPEELERKVDYYVERESLLERHAADLEQKVQERDAEIVRRVRVEAELRTAEEKYRSIFENAVEGIFQSTEDGRFLSANRALAMMLGYADAAELMREVTDISTQLYVDRTRRQELMRRVRGDGAVFDFEAELRRRDGSRMWCSLHARPVYDAEGDLLCIEGTFQDITDRKRAEDEVRRLNEQLEERVAERTVELEAINQELEAFAYSISHDLRTPLRAMDGYSQILLEDYGGVLDEAGRSHLTRIRAGSQRMGRLIEHVLGLSRLTRREVVRQPVDLGEMARAISGELDTGGREIRWSLGEGLVAETDPVLVRVVLENLLGNAVKFTVDRDPAVIELSAVVHEMRTAFRVRDNGVGFDMAHAGKLFGIFEQLHRRSDVDGDGIGLATVHRVVQRLGGSVWAEGEPGKGASFYFTLGE